MRNVPGARGARGDRRYLSLGGIYVAATLLILAWGDILTLLGRSELRFHVASTWVCLALTVVGLVGLSYLIVLASRADVVATRAFRRTVWIYVAAALAVAAVSAVIGAGAYRGLAWQSTLVVICVAFALALVSTTRGVLALVVAVPLCLALTGQPAALFFFAGSMFFNLVFVRLSLWVLGIVRELDKARHTIAVLTLEQERTRFARDLHDVMGRSLSSIALKSELALAAAEVEEKNEHVRDTRAIAQRSLDDMRSLVRGYRDITIGTELDDALMLLRSASILAEVEGDGGAAMDEISARTAAWVVREAVTNVLGHAPDATECTITVNGTVVEIVNDGARSGADTAHTGSGLINMRERVEAAGGTFDAGADGDVFRVRCQFSRTPGARRATVSPIGSGSAAPTA